MTQKPTEFHSRFGFTHTPFTCELPIDDRFVVTEHERELRHLHQAVEQRMSAALIAPAGQGKTTLLRALVKRLPEARYRVSYIKVTDLSKRDLCREISQALGSRSAGTYPALVRTVQARLCQSIEQEGRREVLIFDEAHDFRPDVLGIIRILTNFEMDSRLVVSVLLAGQPYLATLLQRDGLADVASRLGHRARLSLLASDQIEPYLAHRCTLAGCPEMPFEAPARQAIAEMSRGNFRAIDRLALKALQLAHEANQDRVRGPHVSLARAMV